MGMIPTTTMIAAQVTTAAAPFAALNLTSRAIYHAVTASFLLQLVPFVRAIAKMQVDGHVIDNLTKS